MDTWDACEQSWKNGYEKGIHDMARYVAYWLSHISAIDKDALYASIINDFKNHEEKTND